MESVMSDSLLADIFECMPTAIAYTDLEFNVVKTNAQFFLQYGYQDDIVKISHLLNQSIVERRCTEKQWLSTLLQSEFIVGELEIQHKNGTTGWASFRAKLTDQKQGIVWILDDITTHKAVQNKLQLEATVFQVCGEAIIIFDENGRIEIANPAFKKLMGYRVSETSHYGLGSLFSFADEQQEMVDILSQVQEHKQWHGELFLNKKNQDKVPVRMMLNSIQRHSGNSHFSAVIYDISERKAQEKELRQRANHDPLTGLPNRNEFFVRLNDALAMAKRNQYTVALLYLDLDGFKPINDTLGHGQGDEVLQEVAHKLLDCVREVDTVARLGGDEFSVILNGTSEELVAITAERLITAISMRLNDVLHLSVSIGIALYPNDALNPLKLLQYADEAMYNAKQRGKQSYCWHKNKQ